MSVIVKKIKPYPISCDILRAEGQPAIPGEIVKLTDVGFLAKFPPQHQFKVFDKLICRFDLPPDSTFIETHVKVIKIYHGMDATGAAPPVIKGSSPAANVEKVLTMELHFHEISSSHKEVIRNFLRKIGQK